MSSPQCSANITQFFKFANRDYHLPTHLNIYETQENTFVTNLKKVQ